MKRIIPLLLVLLLLPVLSGSADGEGKLIVQGDKGEEVVRIQTRLFDLGYYTYKPTGSYQTVTRSAVVAYQVASGLMSDGSVGQETVQALFSRNAKRVPYHAEITLSYSAQGAIAQKGKAVPWNEIREKLTIGDSCVIRSASTGEEITLLFEGGENHAELSVPTQYYAKNAAVAGLTKWLGTANSFYKCAVLLSLDGQWIAASLQWNGIDHACLYFKGSLSNVLGLPDAEHDANVKKVSY